MEQSFRTFDRVTEAVNSDWAGCHIPELDEILWRNSQNVAPLSQNPYGTSNDGTHAVGTSHKSQEHIRVNKPVCHG